MKSTSLIYGGDVTEIKRQYIGKIIPRNVLTSREAMAEVGWGPTKFWELVNTGEIIGYKDGQWRFERVELEKYKKRRQMG